MSRSSIVGVTLRVNSIDETLPFYTELVGLERAQDDGDGVALVAPGASDTLIRLIEAPRAARAPEAAGLFHLALLFPDRKSLSQVLRRLRSAGYRLTGASDHKVSEALYLNDPAGNGVELYCDRPEEQWRWDADGRVHMTTDALDLGDLLAQSSVGGRDAPEDTIMGHVHLEVTDVDASRAFYESEFGLELTAQRPGARFMSWDGYHHHVGLNNWRQRSEPRPADALGLAEIVAGVSDSHFEQLSRTAADAESSEVSVADPDGLRWRIRRTLA